MLNDSSGPRNPGESSVAQTLNKLVYLGSKGQTVSYKRYKKTVIKQAVALATFGTV
jgi:hypothetical protein